MGIKTIYYSLINKVGAKVNVTGTNIGPQVVPTYINAADNAIIYEDDADCMACKL